MRRILLIDDDQDELIIFREALHEIAAHDCVCEYAENGEQALNMLTHFVPDYMFIDFKMSKMNGLELMSLIKKDNRLAEVRVYLYSAKIGDTIRRLALGLGAIDCITKTGSVQELGSLLKNILQAPVTKSEPADKPDF